MQASASACSEKKLSQLNWKVQDYIARAPSLGWEEQSSPKIGKRADQKFAEKKGIPKMGNLL